MAEEEKKFEGTTLGADAKLEGFESEVDALIAGAIKELGTQEKKEAARPATALSATHINAPEVKPVPPPPPKPKEESQYESTFKEYRIGDIITGTVLKIDNGGALVDIGYKSDGLILPDELDGQVKVGDKIHVMVEKLESREGYVLLSKSRAEEEGKWSKAYEAYKKRTLLDAKVLKAVKGGLLIDCAGIQGFIPASQVSKAPDAGLESFTGKTIPVKIIQINRRQGKLVFSHRLAAPEKDKVDSQKLFDELEAGQIKKGKVSSLKTFGAFVDIGGVDGLVHLSELSWKRVKHPSEVLAVGDEIEVLVLSVDKLNRKISLGLKELQPDPWEQAIKKYTVGQVIKVKILRIVKFGVFVELDKELEGLVHLTELSPKRFERIEEVAKPGDVVEAKILRIMPEEQKIGLSIKQVILDREKADIETVKNQEVKVTIGDMLAEKERQRTESEEEVAEEIT